jgi:hypothetical protein
MVRGGWAAAIVFAVVFAISGCAGGGTTAGAPVPETSPREQKSMNTGTAIECGQQLRIPAGDTLTLTGKFPASSAAGQRSVAGAVEVSSRVAVRGVSSPNAAVVLVQNGRVVTLPGPQDLIGVRWDLPAGTTKQVPGEVTLVSCVDGASVRPGDYELYAWVVVIADDGTRVESVGGPWKFEVR